MITPLSVEKEKVPAYNKPAHDDFGLSSETRGRDVIPFYRIQSVFFELGGGRSISC